MLKVEDITQEVLKYHPEANIDIIRDAYLYSAKAHHGQNRRSGVAYISHPLEVAFNLTRLRMDEPTIAAGLLHDTLEDTLATPAELQELFGEEIYQLVEGVTKISMIEFSSHEESQAENYRKMILAMSKDIRVVLIKLADRAHNMKTLESLESGPQRRIARETLEIYAPIANRLGIGWMKAELENGAFMHLNPQEYHATEKRMACGQDQRTLYVEKACLTLQRELKASKVSGKVIGRPKHLFSIYKKMKQQKIEFDEMYDLVGVRVLTQSVKDCYAVLGLVHALWKPIPGRFKDYIAMPKPNLYQSLHTTVIGPSGERVEVQIRSEKMHATCEEGIAAHWQYKEGGSFKESVDGQLIWVRHLLENQKDLKNPREFINSFKVDMFSDEVYVFTPKGRVIVLQQGATPIDFAYGVHTDVGTHCSAARINGKSVPLRYKLRNGDQVEILTSENQQPSRDWLSFVKTAKARGRILHFIKIREKTRNLGLGKELLNKALVECGIQPSPALQGEAMNEAVRASGFSNYESLLESIGLGKYLAHHFIEKLLPKEKVEEMRKREAGQVKLKEKAREPLETISLKCFNEDILLRIAKCCHPVPGDPISGYITRGRGVTVHHIDCSSLHSLESGSERLVDVEWGEGIETSYPVRVSIVAEDKPGRLAEITQIMADCDINITQANLRQGSHRRAYFDFFIEISDLEHLNRVLHEVRRAPGVIHLERVREYSAKQNKTGMFQPSESGGGPSGVSVQAGNTD